MSTSHLKVGRLARRNWIHSSPDGGHLFVQKTGCLVQICVSCANAAIVTGEGMRVVEHDKDALMVEEDIRISIIFCGCGHLRMLDIQHASAHPHQFL